MFNLLHKGIRLMFFLLMFTYEIFANVDLTGDTLIFPDEISYSDSFEEEAMNSKRVNFRII